MWSHLTDVSYCDVCGKFAHMVGHYSECNIEKQEDIEPHMKYEHPKCRTCGSELTMDLNNDYFCMKSVIREEKHDDHFPNPFTLVLKEDLKWLFEISYDGWCGTNTKTEERIRKMEERYKIDDS